VEKVTDIVDVWFDSGSTHAYVLEQRGRTCVARIALSRGLRPASRLVPFLAA
jgi:isoleucyl-tRNA synthetase